MSEEKEQHRELTQLRQLYYTLLVKMFWEEPPAEFLESLKEGINDRAIAAGQLHPLMGEGWMEIAAYLEDKGAEELKFEFARMYIGPVQPPVSPYESYYLAGSMYKEPLTKVRRFMKKVGLEKQPEKYPEPEDVLAFELEIMNWLVMKELDAGNEKERVRWQKRQAEFFKEHLQVWGPECAKDISEADGAEFYKGAGLILRGFLDLEILTFHEIGPKKVETLEEARKRNMSMRTWKGDIYDPDPVGDPESNVEN